MNGVSDHGSRLRKRRIAARLNALRPRIRRAIKQIRDVALIDRDVEPRRGAGVLQGSEDFRVPDTRADVVLEVEVGVPPGAGGGEVEEADAQVVEARVGAQGGDGVEDEAREGLDEGPVVDARAFFQLVRVAAAVAHEQVDGFQPRHVPPRRDGGDGLFEQGGAHVACEREALELGHEAPEVFADVVFRVQLAPFAERGRLLPVQAFEAEVDPGDGGWEMAQHTAHGFVRIRFGFRVHAVPFPQIGKCYD